MRVRLTLDIDDGVEVDDVVNDLDYNFNGGSGGTVEDTEILSHEVVDV